MGLFDFLWRLLGGSTRTQPAVENQRATRPPSREDANAPSVQSAPTASPPPAKQRSGPPSPAGDATPNAGKRRKAAKLQPLQYQPNLIATDPRREMVRTRPYRFASLAPTPATFLDLSQDSDARWLEYYNLPPLKTPDELADWLGISIGKLAWLTHHTSANQRPESEKKSHYAYNWIPKRKGGFRLIEAPKRELKLAQEQILRNILDHVPTHNAAHGFVAGRSILTNATPHVGRRFILKLDLKDFYTTVRYSRVVAIFRSLGYSREVAIWLARLTTTALPWNIKAPINAVELARYSPRHLPQGGVTSPALANLSAYSLDVRLSGLAGAYHLNYTRYADDLTFSGAGRTIPAIPEFLPLLRRIVRSERFQINDKKCRIIRNGQRQTVTGIVVNERLNVSRKEYDRLKAILHNCVRFGPSTQNRDNHPNFFDHLCGRLAHVLHVNPERGDKLRDLFAQIDWNR